MNILHAIPSVALHHGGPSHSIAGLITSMTEHAAGQVSLISGSDPEEPLIEDLAHRQIVHYANRRFWWPGAQSIARMSQAVGCADVVHVHSYWNGFASVMIALARRADKVVVLSPRGTLQQQAMARSSYRAKAVFAALFGQRQLAGVTGFHFQSEAEAQNSFLAVARPSVIVDNGVNLPEQTALAPALRRKMFGRTAQDINLVFLGRIARIKGIDLQIRTIRLLKDLGISAHLHLLGPDDGDLTRLRALAADLGVTGGVHAHGPVYSNEKYDWLRAADAVLLTSEFENNSNAALEVMAAGGLLVCTDSAIPDGAVQAGAALCVPRDPQTLAGVLSQPLKPTMRDTARAYVRDRHGWGPRAAKMLDFYENLS